MNERRLGRTGLSVSEIGYGAWGIGGSMWLGAEDQESLTALNRAIDLGVNFIDTAAAYGDGHSEQLVGKVVREREERIVVASKIPPKNLKWPAPDGVDPDDAFPADHIRKWTERTLTNLGMDVLDVQQFHVWSDEWVGRGSWLEGVQALKDEGLIRFFGVSINDHQPGNAIKLIETGAVDTVQVIYNVFDQTPEDALLEACERNDVGVIVRVPFDEGALTGRIGAGPRSRRATSATPTSATTACRRWTRTWKRSSPTSASRESSSPRSRCATSSASRRSRLSSRGCGRSATWSATPPSVTGRACRTSRSPRSRPIAGIATSTRSECRFGQGSC